MARKRIEAKSKLNDILTTETVNPDDYMFIPIISPRYVWKGGSLSRLIGGKDKFRYLSVKVKDVLKGVKK